MTHSVRGDRAIGRHLQTCARLGLAALLVLGALETPALADGAGDGQRGGHGGGGGGERGGGGGNRGGRGGGYGGWGGGYYPGPAIVYGDPYYCTPPFVYAPQNPYYNCE